MLHDVSRRLFVWVYTNGMRKELLSLEYFAGGVPAGSILKMHLEGLHKIVDASTKRDEVLSQESEICLIGLVAYFEAFWKDHFASLLNICPVLLTNLRDTGHDTNIDAADLQMFEELPFARLGFLIAERCDFGTARKINAAYAALLRVSPFAREEVDQFDKLLADRNLLVHHGGIYTSRYARHVKKNLLPQDIYYQSLEITPEDFRRAASFVDGIARKTLKVTHAALLGVVASGNVPLSKQRREAIKAILWFPWSPGATA